MALNEKNFFFTLSVFYPGFVYVVCTIKKRPLMMADKKSEYARDNFGKFIYQFHPETKTLIRKLEKILIKLYRQNVSLLFNQTCLNERLYTNTHTQTHTDTHTHIYIYIYIYIYEDH